MKDSDVDEIAERASDVPSDWDMNLFAPSDEDVEGDAPSHSASGSSGPLAPPSALMLGSDSAPMSIAETMEAVVAEFLRVSSVGYCGFGYASTARSTCYECKSKIEKGSARVHMRLAKSKIEKYMHAECAFVMRLPEPLAPPSIAYFTDALSASEPSDAPDPVAASFFRRALEHLSSL